MQRKWLAIAAASGFTAVALGAFGSHGLKQSFTAYQLDIWHTAVQYQMFHTLALLALAAMGHTLCRRMVAAAGWVFTAGIVVFCGSLYLLAFTGIKWLGAITPIGGLAFLAAWVLLLVAAFRKNRP
ncbi:DUF423 domain-containing protein [Porticoccus sp. W117]|uniref:DUF423 domain-containing protein n=1 Tax=Porticoccus sp. W117 TaxID=3054777 RepID=UPI00259ADE63|nr:DUF423 domain-containing protein [Porticoccus sp. W117]MDM3870866.1 DUF423 domain-containing protein [Porticoccus sp. W117]